MGNAHKQKKHASAPHAVVPLPAAGPSPAAGRLRLRPLFKYAVPAMLVPAWIVYFWPLLSAQGHLWNDFIEQNFPYRLFASVWLKKGVFPFWNPYVFSGMPFFADIQTAILYPLNLAIVPFASRGWLPPLVFEYQIAAHFLLAGVLMYALGREFGLCRSASLSASIVFVFGAFMPLHIFHVNLVHSAAWFPLIILCTKRMLERASPAYCCAAALTISLVCFAGYPQLLMHMYYWLAAWLIFFLVDCRLRKSPAAVMVRAVLLFALMIALSAGMSAIQLVPTLELGRYSARPTLSFSESCEGSFRWYRFVTLLVPNFFGRPAQTYWGISPADVNAGPHYYWETAMYCGVLPLVLAFLAIIFVRKRLVWFFTAIGAAAFLCAMGDSFFLYGLFFKLLPMFDRFRTPARFAYLFSISVAMCAGFGLQWLMESCAGMPAQRRALLQRSLFGLGGVAVIAALAVTSGALKGWISSFVSLTLEAGANPQDLGGFIDNKIYPPLVRAIWLFTLLFAAGVTCILLRLRGMLGARQIGGLCCALIFIDLLMFGYGYTVMKGTRNDPSVIFRKTPLVTEIQRRMKQEYFRINSRDSRPGTTDLGGRHMMFHKNQGSVHQIFLMEGYNPLRLKRQLTDRHPKILDILNVKYTIRVDEANGARGFAVNETMLPRARMVYDYIIETDPDKIFSTLKADSFDHVRKVILEERPSFPPASGGDSSAGSAVITAYGLNEITVDVATPKPGLLVLSEIHYPAWKAYIGEQRHPLPLYRANYALRAIEVPEGRHTVRCRFESASVQQGILISALSWTFFLAIIGHTLFFHRRRKISAAPQPPGDA